MELQRNYYAIIPANVRYDENIRPNSKLLYGEITALCNEKGFCWASNQYFAELYKVSKTSISLWIKELIDNGYVSTEIIYKEGSKEILHRYLRIVNDPTQQKLNTPIKEKLKDNTTSFNNTSNNTRDIKDIVPPKKNTSSKPPVRHKYGQYKNVLLSDIDMDKLKKEFPSDWESRIEKVSEYVETSGKKYKNFLAVIRSWAKKDFGKPQSKFGPKTRKETLPDWATDNYNHEKAEEARRSGINFGELPKINFDDDLPF